MMGATKVEYKFRWILHAVIIMLGFWAPWCEALGWTRMTTWLVLSSWLSRTGWLSFVAATNAVLIVAIACVAYIVIVPLWSLAGEAVTDGLIALYRKVLAWPIARGWLVQ